MFRNPITVSFIFLLVLSGCATSGQTTLLGLGLGSLVGGAIGSLADAGKNGRLRAQNIFMGSSIGGAAAATSAFLLHPKDDKKEEMASFADKTNALMKPPAPLGATVDHPLLVPPRVETRYLDDQVKGNTFIPGHLEFQLVQPGQWSRE